MAVIPNTIKNRALQLQKTMIKTGQSVPFIMPTRRSNAEALEITDLTPAKMFSVEKHSLSGMKNFYM